MIKVGLELFSLSEMSEFCINISSGPGNNRRENTPPCAEVTVQCNSFATIQYKSFFSLKGVDNESCAWSLETDLHSNSLRFPFYLLDINKIPRNHLRLGNYFFIYAIVKTSRFHYLLLVLIESINASRVARTV